MIYNHAIRNYSEEDGINSESQSFCFSESFPSTDISSMSVRDLNVFTSLCI